MYFKTRKNVNFEKEKNIKSYKKNLKIISCPRGESPLLECIIFLLVRIDLFCKMWWEMKTIDFR